MWGKKIQTRQCNFWQCLSKFWKYALNWHLLLFLWSVGGKQSHYTHAEKHSTYAMFISFHWPRHLDLAKHIFIENQIEQALQSMWFYNKIYQICSLNILPYFWLLGWFSRSLAIKVKYTYMLSKGTDLINFG